MITIPAPPLARVIARSGNAEAVFAAAQRNLARVIARSDNAEAVLAAAQRDTGDIVPRRARAVSHSTTMRLSTLTAIELRVILAAAGDLIDCPRVAAIRLDCWGDAIVRVALGVEGRSGSGDVRYEYAAGRSLVTVRIDCSFDHAATEIRGDAHYQMQLASNYAAFCDAI